MPDLNDPRQAAAWLRKPAVVRDRARRLLALGEQDRLAHFQVDLSRMAETARYVAEVIRTNYPDLKAPYHARWRHFAAGGIDRWGTLAQSLTAERAEIARIRIDLCVVSVLLDAGAGPDWRYQEAETDQTVTRSEGLAVASLHAFRAGLFSGDANQPLRADAEGLARVTAAALGAAFQVGPDNPLVGLEGRAALLRNVAAVLRGDPALFGSEGRLGRLYDRLMAQRIDGAVPAEAILAAILEGLNPIWPDRLTLGDVSLGDVWRHPAIEAPDLTNGLIPFHKLSQWMAYSLVEIFEDAGVRVSGLDALTGLPEYRNGGLFLDMGVLRLRDPALASQSLAVDSQAVVEWRGLTVALLDRLADSVRALLGKTSAEMPLACVLEGGSWAAGRKIARALRPGGGPPLQVISDGTVF